MDNVPSICFFCRLTYPNFAFGGGELQKISFLQCFLLRGFCRKKTVFLHFNITNNRCQYPFLIFLQFFWSKNRQFAVATGQNNGQCAVFIVVSAAVFLSGTSDFNVRPVPSVPMQQKKTTAVRASFTFANCRSCKRQLYIVKLKHIATRCCAHKRAEYTTVRLSAATPARARWNCGTQRRFPPTLPTCDHP